MLQPRVTRHLDQVLGLHLISNQMVLKCTRAPVVTINLNPATLPKAGIAQQLTEGTRQFNTQANRGPGQSRKLFNGSALAGIADTDDAGSAWLEAPPDRKRAVIDALAVVTLLKGGHGRPAGWQPGQTYSGRN